MRPSRTQSVGRPLADETQRLLAVLGGDRPRNRRGRGRSRPARRCRARRRRPRRSAPVHRLSHCRPSSAPARAAVTSGRSRADARRSCRSAAGRRAARPGRWCPRRARSSTVIVASWASTIAFTIVRPSPVPWMWRRSASRARYMRSNRRPRSSGGRCRSRCRRPASAIEPGPPLDARPSTWPPRGVNLIAFETRFSSTWREAMRIAVDRPGTASRTRARARPRPARRAGRRPRAVARRELAEVGLARARSRTCPAVILVSSSRSPTRLSSRRRVALDHLDEPPSLLAQVLGLDLGEELGVADDRGQRGAQLVRDEAEEVVLEPLRVALRGDVAAGPDQPPVSRRRRRTACPRPRSSAYRAVGEHDPVGEAQLALAARAGGLELPRASRRGRRGGSRSSSSSELGGGPVGLEAVVAVLLRRPGALAGRQVELPAADAGDLLRVGELPALGGQHPLGLHPLGDLAPDAVEEPGVGVRARPTIRSTPSGRRGSAPGS